MHIAVYHAYIALHIPYTYHSGRTTIPCTSAYKRAYAPLYTPCPTHKRRITDAPCPAKPEKVRIQGDTLRALYGIKPQFLYPLYHFTTLPLYPKKSPP